MYRYYGNVLSPLGSRKLGRARRERGEAPPSRVSRQPPRHAAHTWGGSGVQVPRLIETKGTVKCAEQTREGLERASVRAARGSGPRAPARPHARRETPPGGARQPHRSPYRRLSAARPHENDPSAATAKLARRPSAGAGGARAGPGGDGGVAGVGVERVQRGREVEAREARPGELELDPGPQVHACDAGGASRRTAACTLLCTRRARLVLHTGRLARSLRRSIQGAVHTPTAVPALAANGRMSRPRPPRARKSRLGSSHDSDRLGSQVTTRIRVARDEGGGGGPRPPGPRLLRTQLLMLIVNRGLQF